MYVRFSRNTVGPFSNSRRSQSSPASVEGIFKANLSIAMLARIRVCDLSSPAIAQGILAYEADLTIFNCAVDDGVCRVV